MASEILTPDQRLRVFVSSTLGELAEERAAVRAAVSSLRLVPVLFELGARPYPPRRLYSAYLEQSHVFVGIYWQSYGWIAPDHEISGLEDEYRLAGGKPKLLYVKEPAPDREPRLEELIAAIEREDGASYRPFATAAELGELVADDLAVLLTEGFRAPSPSAPPEPAPAAGVPAARTSFVGRDGELAALDELLEREDVRLVTLTGPGGIGKTRLASEAARRSGGRYRDGAAFVALDSLWAPELVPAAIAGALGVRDGALDALGALEERLRDAELLLVLDNFEQLVEAADVVGRLLDAAPRVDALVTSRELLRIRGEHELAVSPLAPGGAAERLFAERAVAVRRGFRPADDPEAVEEICRRLDGMPLAIELAAAAVRLLTPRALLARLEDSLELPAARLRDLPERQRTLRAAMDWSYDLLSEEERAVLARLGVFAGSFTVEAAEWVCDPDGEHDLLGVLAALLDKSLVGQGADELRFTLLNVVREYALGRLVERGEDAGTRDRHAAVYRDLAVSAHDGLRGEGQAAWVSRLDADADNLRAALARLLALGRGDDMAELLWSAWPYWWIRGHVHEGRMWAAQALALDGVGKPARLRLLAFDGSFALFVGDYEAAVTELEGALPALRELGDSSGVAHCLIALALVVAIGDADRALAMLGEALALAEASNDGWSIAAALSGAGWVSTAYGRYDDPDPFERGVEAAERLGEENMRGMALTNLADLRMHERRWSDAARLELRALELFRAMGMTHSSAYSLESAARIAAHRGATVDAARLIAAAASLRESLGMPLWGAAADRREQLVDALRGELGAEEYDRAADAGRSLDLAAALELAIDSVR